VADGGERYRLATAVAYAALETEVARENARYLLYREGRRVLAIATEGLGSPYRASVAARAQYARRLGERADELAGAEPLLAPARATEALSSLPAPEGDRPIPPDRLVRLAVRASEQAALSSRLEIYPKGMPAPRALKLGMGSLLGPKAVTVQQIQQRIGSRYSEAAPIPGPPLLTRLLTEAGHELAWDGQSQRYSPTRRPGDPSTTSTLQRFGTASQPGATPTPEVEDARALEERIRQVIEHRRFLVLSVALKHLLRAERELLGRFPLRRVSIEGLLIDRMKSLAGQAGASWEVVLRADATEREGNDWRNLMTLVRRAVPPLEQALLRLEGPALLIYPGLLARYGQMEVIERLRDAGDRETGSPGFIVLVPADRQTDMPVIDGRELPVVLASQWAHLTEAWISNAHRSDTSSRRGSVLPDVE
ncbi:MAG: BREX system serine/threonine kinase PglW, partial [Gammaproteobacteria bacterium]